MLSRVFFLLFIIIYSYVISRFGAGNIYYIEYLYLNYCLHFHKNASVIIVYINVKSS